MSTAPRTISLINQKGGCGKSSTCFHLAGFLAGAGYQVLLIDADPQGSLSQGFFGSALLENLENHETLAALFDEEYYAATDCLIVRTQYPGISIVRANQTLAPHNIPAPDISGLKQFILRSYLEEVSDFDLVLIDCPPNLYQCSWNALLASEFVVIPVPPEDFATQGLRMIHQAIDNAVRLNAPLRLLGHLVTRVDSRLLVHRSYEQKLRTLYPDTVLTTTIPEASAFKVSISCRQPVSYFSANSRAARSIQALASEILNRIAVATKVRSVA